MDMETTVLSSDQEAKIMIRSDGAEIDSAGRPINHMFKF